jgi:hypothetical protein
MPTVTAAAATTAGIAAGSIAADLGAGVVVERVPGTIEWVPCWPDEQALSRRIKSTTNTTSATSATSALNAITAITVITITYTETAHLTIDQQFERPIIFLALYNLRYLHTHNHCGAVWYGHARRFDR